MRLTQAKKNKEREKKEMEATNRKHLANMRVVQKNLVYIVGLSPRLAREEFIPALKSANYFGQYGRVAKILINKRSSSNKFGHGDSSIGVYVTYQSKEDAARAIVAIDGSKEPGGRIIRASYGTTKYCTSYLRNLPCSNPGCTYLHEPGEEADSFTKEDLSTLRHAAKDTEHKIKPASMHLSPIKKGGEPLAPPPPALAEVQDQSALPRTASWASGKPPGAVPAPAAVAREQTASPAPKKGGKTAAKAAEPPKAAANGGRPAKAPTQPEGRKERTSAKDKGADRKGADATAPASPAPAAATAVPATDGELDEESTYRPSRNAQQLIDDLHQRRTTDAAAPPLFPDLDWTLSTFSDGDFSFNLPATSISNGAAAGDGASPAFALDPTPAVGGGGLPDLSAPSVMPERDLPLNYTAYQGSFNPFDTDVLTQDMAERTSMHSPMAAPAGAAAAPADGWWQAREELASQQSAAQHMLARSALSRAVPQARATQPPPGIARRAEPEYDVPHESQRSAAAAMLAARAQQLKDAGAGAPSALDRMDDMRAQLGAQPATPTQAPTNDSKSLLALLRRIQGDAPEAHARPGGSPVALHAESPAMHGPVPAAHSGAESPSLAHARSQTHLVSPPGLEPPAQEPGMAKGLLLAQLLGTPSVAKGGS